MKNNNFDSINAAANNNSENNGGMIMMNATIKTMDVFAQVVKEAVEASLGDGYEVSIHEVLKNNDTHLTGLTIRTEESNVAPTIYLEGSFERYKAGDAAVPSGRGFKTERRISGQRLFAGVHLKNDAVLSSVASWFYRGF